MNTVIAFCAGVALVLVFAVFASQVVEVGKRFKRSQQLQAEGGGETAGQREFDWYWNSDPERRPGKFHPRELADR